MTFSCLYREWAVVGCSAIPACRQGIAPMPNAHRSDTPVGHFFLLKLGNEQVLELGLLLVGD
jgi:hypothetical protein